MVSQDRVSVFVVSRSQNCVYHYKKNSDSGKMELSPKITVGYSNSFWVNVKTLMVTFTSVNYGDNTVSKIEVPSFKTGVATAGEEGQDKVVKNYFCFC